MSNTIRGTLSAGIAKWVSNNDVAQPKSQKPQPLHFDVEQSNFEGKKPPPGPPPFLDAAADALGLDSTDLAQRLRHGESLEDIADSQGVSTENVLEAIAADFQAKHPEASDDEADAIAERAFQAPARQQPPGLDTLSQKLGITTDELQARLEAGENIASIAKSLGLEPFRATQRIPIDP
ncbi:MAG: hypothetical protein ACO1OB_12665 [Archangium sp.]